MSQTYFHAGDLGDIIAALPAIRQLGGGTLSIGDGFCRESMAGARFDAIKPLLEAQLYIDGVVWSDRKPTGARDISDFRKSRIPGESLAHWQARHLGVTKLDTSPWLSSKPIELFRDRVVFARSKRYENGFFPWFALIKRYPDALFVGTGDEHQAFQSLYSCKLTHVPTSSLLQLACVIAGARLFCGNQSCPWWIAIGLGVTTFQETWTHDRNSMIERPNAHYMLESSYDLEALPR